jgi:hypothetical protein
MGEDATLSSRGSLSGEIDWSLSYLEFKEVFPAVASEHDEDVAVAI